MAEARTSGRPGRPKDVDKRDSIVAAARQLLMGSLYHSVTMDQIATAASVAKMTLYGHFKDKETLFEAVVASISTWMTEALPAIPRGGGDLEEELVAFGRRYLAILLSPGVVRSMNNHFDLVARNPELAQRFYNAGPGRTRAILAAFLQSQMGHEGVGRSRSVEAACDLTSLWLGDMQQQLALGIVRPLSQGEIEQRVRRCTRIFLTGYAAYLRQDD